MANRSIMEFSIPVRASYLSTEIGSVGETVWNLSVSFDSYGSGWVVLNRSIGNGEVKLDVRGIVNGRDFIVINDHVLLDRKKTAYLKCLPMKETYRSAHAENVKFKGCVTVYYNSNCTPLASVSEGTTHSDNVFNNSIAEKRNPSLQLVNDLLHLLDNQDSFSDATLVCGSSKIQVHRNILSARSPVFAAMFKTQMQEGREGVVDIVDMEPDVLQAMLRYVYSGKTDHLTNSLAGDLLFASDKYQLEELKVMCVEELKLSMASNNVFRSLVMGDLHDKSLKEHAVGFICKCKNFSDLEKTKEWQSLLKERPSLTVEVMTALVRYLQNK